MKIEEGSLQTSVEIAKAYLSGEGYIILEFFQENITLSKEEVRYGWNEVAAIDPEKKRPVYLKTAQWSLLDSEARNYVIKEIASRPSVAILIYNLGQKLMGNFAIKLSGRSKNIRIFEKEELAKAWLKERIKISSTFEN